MEDCLERTAYKENTRIYDTAGSPGSCQLGLLTLQQVSEIVVLVVMLDIYYTSLFTVCSTGRNVRIFREKRLLLTFRPLTHPACYLECAGSKFIRNVGKFMSDNMSLPSRRHFYRHRDYDLKSQFIYSLLITTCVMIWDLWIDNNMGLVQTVCA
jgi:hypothetical protein